MGIEYGTTPDEDQAKINAYVREVVNRWKEELALSEEVLKHTAPGEFYQFHQEKQGFLRDQITLYESMLLDGYGTEEKPAPSEGL